MASSNVPQNVVLFCVSVAALSICCLVSMLYIQKVLALVVTLILRYLVLPKRVVFQIGAIQLSILHARILFRDVLYVDENMSLRIVDGYLTFNYWGYWLHNFSWTILHEYMLDEHVVGARCRVAINLGRHRKGTVVAVHKDKKKVMVQLDGRSWSGEDEEDEEDIGDADSRSRFADGESVSSNQPSQTDFIGRPFETEEEGAHGAALHRRGSWRARRQRMDTPFVSGPMLRSDDEQQSQQPPLARSPTPTAGARASSQQPSRGAGANSTTFPPTAESTLIKAFDPHRVSVRANPGRCRLHVNGMRACIYNTTGKYRDLANAAAENASNNTSGAGHSPSTSFGAGGAASTSARSKGSTAKNKNNNNNKGNQRSANSSSGGGHPPPTELDAVDDDGLDHEGMTTVSGAKPSLLRSFFSQQAAKLFNLESSYGCDAEVEAARKLQAAQLKSRSLSQRFYDFVAAVEVELYAIAIDIGSVEGTFPYFLHLTAHRSEGRLCHTNEGCPSIDLYRFVAELTMQGVDLRMAHIHDTNQSPSFFAQTLLQRAALLVRGTSGNDDSHVGINNNGGAPPANDASPSSPTASTPDLLKSDLLSKYGIILDGTDKGSVHVVFYRDAPNVYAGETVVRGSLPTMGIELLLDSPRIRYGPWLEYSRTKFWDFFFPPNYRPLEPLHFEVGQPRPFAGFEFFAEFLRDTSLEIAFKRRYAAPNPPFGLINMRPDGLLVATLGGGTQYIQPAFFLLRGEEKQVYQGLLSAPHITVKSNGVLNATSTLCTLDSLQCFIDREDDRLWNGRRRFNVLPKISSGEVFFHMSYVDYFMALLDDWQYAENSYLGVPLTTERFNTLERAVTTFVPNVKRFEVFVDGILRVHVSVNDNNVIYSEDPNDMQHNIFAVVTATGFSFSMVLPSDVYQLSCDNEIARPLQGSAGDLKAYLSLPPSHPLHEYISTDVPWATCGKLRFKGLFTGMTANQAIPQLLDRMKGTTGRTLQSNFFELELDFHQLRGNLLGVHVKALLNCFDNIFLDNTLPIRPDELFWLLAKIQSSATTGKNKRKEYTQFLQSKSSQPNDMELSVLVRITDMEVNAQAVRGVGQRGIHAPPPPTVNLSAGVFTFTYVKQFSVADTQVTLSPIALRFLEASDATTSTTKGGGGGGGGTNTTRAICADRYLCVGYINVSLVKHFGRMPYRPKVHESFSIHINGLSFDMDLPQLIVLSQVLQSFAETFKMEDAQLVSEVAEARAEAEYAAERLLLKRSTRRGKTGGLSERVPTFRIAATSTTEEMEVGHMNSTAADMTSPTFVINNTANNNLLLRQESPTTTAAISAEVGHNIIASDDGNPSDRSAFLLGASRSIFDASPTSTRSGVHALRNIAANALNTSVVTSHATVEIDPLLDFAYDDDADFGDTVPRDLAEEFAEFMEMVNVAEDTAKDYGLFFTSVSVRRVGGLVHIPDTGVFSVEAPQGLRLGHSTFNDGNSNKRMSAMAKQISIRGLVKDDGRSSGSSPKLSGTINMTNLGLGRSEMVEVLHFRTSVALRHYIAYSLNGSIEAHREKQKAFLVEHDYESLLDASLFDPTSEDITKANNTPAPAAGAATSSPPPSRAAAKQQSSPTTSSPSPARPPQHVGATPGAALDNNLDLSSSTGGNDDDDSGGGPPISRRLRLATHGQHHDGTESSTRAATDVESTFLDLIHARGMEASSSWIEPPEEQPSQPFANHQTHDTTATNTSALFSTCGDELHDEDVTGGGGTSSHRFATCISATSYTLASDAEEGGLHGAGGSSSSSNDGGEEDGAMRRAHNLNKTTNSATATAGGVDLNSSYDLQEEIPLTSFVRGYIRDPNNDGEPTVLQYCAARTTTSTSSPSSATSTRPTQRRRAYYHASIPYPAFLEVGDSSNCPSFSAVPTMMMMDEGSAATTDGFAVVDDLLWSRKRADNRERCRNKTTSKHYHVEATDPVQLLVTKSAIFLAATAIRVVTEIHYAEDEARRAASRLKGDALRTPHTPASSYAASRRKKRGKTLFAEHLPTGRQLHSRSRVLQKKWLWEDHLYSFEVPLIEIKLLSQLPIPVTNAVDPQHPGDGIYCSTVVLRAIKLNARRSEPPEGEATSISSVASRKLSISLKLLSVGLYTQVEYEPIRRRGNLNVSIPFIGYDQSKDTIAVAYLLHCHGQAKRDLVRGVEGGGSKVFVQAIEAHGCRDFIDYVVAMVALVREVDEGVRQRLRVLTSLAPLTKRGAGAAHEGELSAASDVMAMREVSEVSEAHPPPRRRGLSVRVMEPRKTTSTTSTSPAQPETPPQKRSTFIFTRWQTLQCRCSVERILIRLVDATKSGRVVHVDLNSASTLEVLRPSLNVEVIMPRRHQDTTIQVNGVAAIQALRVKLYPTLLSILQPRSTQPLGHPLRGGFMEPPTTNVFGEESSFSAAAATSGMHQNISSPHLHKSSSSSMSGLRLCLNGTFSLAEIDVSVMHSELNFVHLNGTKFRGSASTRAEAISSRECVQTEALTENISNGIRRQLRVLAERARLRAKKSNYAAPPFTTSQLQLCSSYALFMEKMECEYVADAILPLGNSESHLAMMGDESPPTWNRKNSVVFHALVDDLSALVESTNQYDVVGEQININVLVHQLQLSSPYRPQAAQTVHPQVHLFLNAWIAAAESAMRRIDEVRRTAMPATDNVNINAVPITAMSSRIMNPTNRAVTLSLQAHNLEAIMGLPQKIRQTIVFPQLSLFLQSSSGDRVAMKIHLHPFNVSSTAESSYVVGLPHVYITFAQDDIKTTCTVMIEVLNITLHPLFVNHALLAYGKVVDELVPMFSKRVRITTPSNNNTPTTTTANNNNKMITPTARRRRLFFIVRGMRLSYVTSMTNLRFSMRHLNAKAESEAQSANEHRLGWVVHVTSAQLALVDREDHDQSRRLQASHVEQRRASQSKTNSVDSTPLLANTTTSAGTRRGDANDARSTNSATGGQSPLGGFIWGSAELSCTLTGGRTDRNLARETLLANDVFRAYSTDLQTELLNQLSHSSYRWELTVLSPLIILRCGLDAMLRQCSDETVHDIQRLKQAMLYQDRIFKQRLTQHSEFTRLQREKSRNDQLYRRAAEEHLIRLRAMTEEVVRQVEQTPQNNQRRASLAPTTDASSVGMNVPSTSAIPPAEDEVRQLLRDCFCIKTEHKFSGTISTVCVVIPFGDAAFKSLVEELPSAFGCGKQERHVHSQMCLRRRSFVPMLALKLGVEEVSLFCGVEQSRWESSAAAARMPTASASASAAAAVFTAATSRHPRTSTTTTTTTTTANNTKRGILKQPPPPPPEFTESLTFCGRFSASGTKLYFTDGTELSEYLALRDVLDATTILGGLGELTSRDFHAELHRSRNTLNISSIDFPMRITRQDGHTRVCAVLDLSEPQMQMSSHIISILNELVKESSTLTLRCDASDGTTTRQSHDTSHSSRTMEVDEMGMSVATNIQNNTSINNISTSSIQPPPKTTPPSSLSVDVAARLDAGVLQVYSYTAKDGAPSPNATSTRGSPRLNSKSPRRRVGFGAASGVYEHRHEEEAMAMMMDRDKPTLDHSMERMHCVFTMPLPAVSVQGVAAYGNRNKEQDEVDVHVEVRAGSIELGPSITTLAKEIEACACIYNIHQQKRSERIVSLAEEMEDQVPELLMPLHCNLLDLLVPVPRAMAAVLSKSRMHSVKKLRRPDTSITSPNHASTTSPHKNKSSSTSKQNLDALVQRKITHPSLTAIHVSLNDLKVTFSCEPVASTSVMVFLEDNGGVDVLITLRQQPSSLSSSASPSSSSSTTTTALQPYVEVLPEFVLVCTARRLRAECQTRLEVKSLEIALPEAQAIVSQRGGRGGEVTSITVNLPLMMEGSRPNIIILAQHTAQVFSVVELWQKTVLSTLRSVRNIFDDGTPGAMVAEHMANTPLARTIRSKAQHALAARRRQADRRWMCTACLTSGLCHADLGGGSLQQLAFGALRFSVEKWSRSMSCTTYVVSSYINNLHTRSEGALSGMLHVATAGMQMFLIENVAGGEVFVRSKSNRTMRAAVVVENAHANFKERQVKDVFECRVGDFRLHVMDGMSEEGYTTVELDGVLAKGKLGVTPSTVPTFLTFVRTVSSIISEQRASARGKLLRSAFFLERVDGGDGSPLEGHAHPLQDHRTSASQVRRSASLATYSPNTHKGSTSPSSVSTPPLSSPLPPSHSPLPKDDARAPSPTSPPTAAPVIPFLGRAYTRVPCGQVRVSLEETSLLLGAMSSGEAATGCVVVHLPRARLSYAETACEDYKSIKKVLRMETHNVEISRPGPTKVVILGFKSSNHFEFFTQQQLGSSQVGFVMTLTQRHPWTGNPRFRDFEEIINLVHSFTDKANADVFQHFGRVPMGGGDGTSMAEEGSMFQHSDRERSRKESGSHQASGSSAAVGINAHSPAGSVDDAMGGGGGLHAATSAIVTPVDARTLKALRGSAFSPQLRFGGDVSVNTDVILNWLGITESMLPYVLHTKVCDAMEAALDTLASNISERVRQDSPSSSSSSLL